MATPWSKTHRSGNHTFRKFRDGDHRWPDLESQIFEADHSHKCPTYVHRTPPCQGSCPAGEDVRGWLQVVRGLEKPPEGMSWQEYTFRRATDANPFPAQMGRVCPAPCEDGCNRNEVEDFVGINSVEQFIGDSAIAESFAFAPPERETGKRIAIVGGGPAGLTAAYQLRRRGHRCTVYDDHEALGVRFAVLAESSGRLRPPAPEQALEGVPERGEQHEQEEPDPAQCDRDRTRSQTGADASMSGLCEGQRQHRDSVARNQRCGAKRLRRLPRCSHVRHGEKHCRCDGDVGGAADVLGAEDANQTQVGEHRCGEFGEEHREQIASPLDGFDEHRTGNRDDGRDVGAEKAGGGGAAAAGVVAEVPGALPGDSGAAGLASESAERYRPSAGSSRNSSRKPPFNFNRSRTEKHLRTSDSKFSAV